VHLFFSFLEPCIGRADEFLFGWWVLVSPVCDSYVRPETLVRICDECNFGTYGGRCIICGSPGERIFLFFIISPPQPRPYAHAVVLDLLSLLTYVSFPFPRLI
jgi:hypothetical protein